MSGNRTSPNANGVPAGWRVEIGEGSILPQGAYSMIELDATTCAFERPARRHLKCQRQMLCTMKRWACSMLSAGWP
jgi:hypothetical protein